MNRSRILTALVALVPALTGLVALSAAADRADGIDTVPAAVVNADEIVTMEDGTQLPAGRLLTAELTEPQTRDVQFAWEIVPADVADAGLESGEYYAVVTIPRDFSQSIVDMMGGVAQPAEITLEASDPSSPLMARLSGEVTEAAADLLGQFFTQQYLNGSLNGSTQLHDAMQQAADGAGALADGAGQIGDGADALADGNDQLADGLGLLAGGARQAGSGADELAGGASALAGGANLAADGAGQLADGASALASGVAGVDSGASALSDGASQLSSGLTTYSGGMNSLAAGSSELVTGANALSDGADLLAEGTRQLSDGLTGLTTDTLGVDVDTLIAGLEEALGLAQDAVAGLAAIQEQWDAWVATLPTYDQVVEDIRAAYSGAVAEQCAAATTPEAIAICESLAGVQIPGSEELNQQFQAALEALKAQLATIPTGNPDYPTLADVLTAALEASEDLESSLPTLEDVDTFLAKIQTLVDQAPGMLEGVEALADGASDLADGASALADGITEFDTGVQQLAGGASALSAGATGLSDGASLLADGTGQLNSGASQLASGLGAYADGADQLAGGANALAGGANQLADGVWQLADGTGQSAAGAGALAEGAGQLADGIGELASGSSELADGLAEGAGQIPVYTEEEAAALAATLVRPIVVDSLGGGSVSSWTTFAPTAAALVLWLGALATYLVLEAVPTARRFSAVGPVRLAFAGFWPGATLGVVQAAVLVGVLAITGVNLASPLVLIGVALVAAVVFAALHQGLAGALGRRAGLIVSLVLAVVQAASLTTLMPASTVPGLLQPVAEILPMGLAAQGLTTGVLGGSGSLGGVVLGLAVWAALGFALAVAGAKSRQGVRIGELRNGFAVTVA